MRKTTKNKQNVNSSHEQQRQQYKKCHLPQSRHSLGKASVKTSKRQNNSLTAVACDMHKKTKRASPSTATNIAR